MTARRDCSHEADSPFRAIPNVLRVINVSAVVVMGVDEGIDNTHYHDSILKASWKNLGDQVVEKMASPWKRSSLSPKRGKEVVQQRTLL